MYSQELVMQYVYQGWDRMLWSDARKVRSASASSTDCLIDVDTVNATKMELSRLEHNPACALPRTHP
jgi:hypothetical protein